MDAASEADLEALEQLNSIINQVAAQSNNSRNPPAVLSAVQKLANASSLAKECEDPDEFVAQMVERIAIGIVKTILSTKREKKQTQLVSELSFLLQSFVL